MRGRFKRIFGATEDGRIGTEEFSEPVHLRLSSWTMIAGIAHLIDYVRHEFSLSGQDIREGWVNGRIGKGNIVAIAVGTRHTSIIPISPRAQHHPVIKQNRLAIEDEK